jgi:hypothetical protein
VGLEQERVFSQILQVLAETAETDADIFVHLARGRSEP